MTTAASQPLRVDAGLLWKIVRDTATEWFDANPFRLAAALAYYTLFSMAPILVIAVGVAGSVFGEDAVQGRVFAELRTLFGDEGAAALQKAVIAARLQSNAFLPTLVGLVGLLIGASAVFAELQDALNFVWHAKPEALRWSTLLRKRLLSFAMVLVVGFLLLVSLAISAFLGALGAYVGGYMAVPIGALELGNFVLSFLITTLLFAAIYKVLPDIDIAWHDVAVGAAVTAALFTSGKSAIGFYLGHSVVASTYGAAGALAVLLVWLYYSALILFFGAVFTRVYDDTVAAARRNP
jgi:membrane protein